MRSSDSRHSRRGLENHFHKRVSAYLLIIWICIYAVWIQVKYNHYLLFSLLKYTWNNIRVMNLFFANFILSTKLTNVIKTYFMFYVIRTGTDSFVCLSSHRQIDGMFGTHFVKMLCFHLCRLVKFCDSCWKCWSYDSLERLKKQRFIFLLAKKLTLEEVDQRGKSSGLWHVQLCMNPDIYAQQPLH